MERLHRIGHSAFILILVISFELRANLPNTEASHEPNREFEISLAASVNVGSTLDFQLTVVVRRGVGAASEVSETSRSFKRGYSDVAMP